MKRVASPPPATTCTWDMKPSATDLLAVQLLMDHQVCTEPTVYASNRSAAMPRHSVALRVPRAPW